VSLADVDIQNIVDRVVRRLSDGKRPQARTDAREHGVFATVDEAIAHAEDAFHRLQEASLETRAKMIAAMRQAADAGAHEISEEAVRETGLGRVKDKLNKNRNAIWQTPGLEDIKPLAVTGDHGLTLTDYAPYGVIGSITPTTNPTETIICNAIGMVSGGNSVVFNTHPGAKGVSARCVSLLNEAIVSAGGPKNVLSCVADPTIESAGVLMKHPKIALLVVTGGPAVVKAAMSSSKKAICAGPGNPPAVVDKTADVARAARDIYLGASLDNNIVCIVEKEIIAEAEIADALKRELQKQGAHLLNASETSKLERILVDGHSVNKRFVGKDAAVIAREIGLSVHPECRLLFCEVDSAAHPFMQAELLMPVIPLLRVSSFEEAVGTAVAVEHGFRHTAVIHSTHIDHMHVMARAMNCSIFVKNGPSFAGLGMGGEGHTSYTIASPTGEGLTSARHFVRARRCTLTDSFRIV
jgi:acyl-CoA reductase-like NAD-dependent aldehyde dehydrogenase